MDQMERIIIHTEGLTKCYGEKTAVSELNLDIRKGEIFGLLGPNGAGKTTTILMLLGLTEPTSGTASINGRDCTRDPIGIKTMVGYLPDQMGFYADMTGRENLRFTGRLNGLKGTLLEERIDSLLERVRMTEAADKKTGTYSRGMKQRLGIADVLMKDPQVVIMDEPTLGIDPEGMRELTDLIRRLSVGGWPDDLDLFPPAVPGAADLRPGGAVRRRKAHCLRKDRRAGRTGAAGRKLCAGNGGGSRRRRL